MKFSKTMRPDIAAPKDKKESLRDQDLSPEPSLNFKESDQEGRDYNDTLEYLYHWLLVDKKEIARDVFQGVFSSPSRMTGVTLDDIAKFTYHAARAGEDAIRNVAKMAAMNPDNPDLADLDFDKIFRDNQNAFEDIKVSVIDCVAEITRVDGSKEVFNQQPYMYFEYDESDPGKYRIVPWYKDLAQNPDTISSIEYIHKKITNH